MKYRQTPLASECQIKKTVLEVMIHSDAFILKAKFPNNYANKTIRSRRILKRVRPGLKASKVKPGLRGILNLQKICFPLYVGHICHHF